MKNHRQKPEHNIAPEDPAKDTLYWIINSEQAGQRLDKLLAYQFPDIFSREEIKLWIQQARVHVNGTPCIKPSFKPNKDDAVQINVPHVAPLNLPHEDLSATGLSVIYEDDALLVVNKPSGMLTHPAGSQLTGTLVNGLLYHCNGQLSSENSAIRPGIVHRLDRFTSGLLMVAKTNAAHRHLAQQLKERTAHRQYIALTHGVPPSKTGTINAPLGRDTHKRDQQCVSQDGRHAITHWTLLETGNSNTAKVQFNLETGRTHQIRVHCQYKKFPIIGDIQYGDGFAKAKHMKTNGQLLQAQEIEFSHPLTEKTMHFCLPIDPEIQTVWNQLTEPRP